MKKATKTPSKTSKCVAVEVIPASGPVTPDFAPFDSDPVSKNDLIELVTYEAEEGLEVRKRALQEKITKLHTVPSSFPAISNITNATYNTPDSALTAFFFNSNYRCSSVTDKSESDWEERCAPPAVNFMKKFMKEKEAIFNKIKAKAAKLGEIKGTVWIVECGNEDIVSSKKYDGNMALKVAFRIASPAGGSCTESMSLKFIHRKPVPKSIIVKMREYSDAITKERQELEKELNSVRQQIMEIPAKTRRLKAAVLKKALKASQRGQNILKFFEAERKKAFTTPLLDSDLTKAEKARRSRGY